MKEALQDLNTDTIHALIIDEINERERLCVLNYNMKNSGNNENEIVMKLKNSLSQYETIVNNMKYQMEKEHLDYLSMTKEKELMLNLSKN